LISEQTEIVRATPADIEIIQILARQTFIEAFSFENLIDNMMKYLDESFSFEKLIEELNNPDSEFYLIYSARTPIGYLKINMSGSQTELQDSNSLEIQRIYVLKEFYGKQAGQSLFNKALEIAKLKKVDYIWLGVWENNFRAVNFYKKNGFVKFSEHAFRFGDDIQTDIMMKLEVKK